MGAAALVLLLFISGSALQTLLYGSWRERHELSALLHHANPFSAAAVCPAPTSPRSPIRLLVTVAAATYAAHRLPYLQKVIGGYLGYSEGMMVDVIVDTGDVRLVDKLAALYPAHALPAGKTLKVQLWTPEQLHKLTQVTGVAIDPIAFAITHVHRHYIGTLLSGYDYVVYTEDDLFLRETSFALFVERSAELWKLGWLLGFLRTEINEKGVLCTPDMWRRDVEGGAETVRTLGGRRYREPPNPYYGMWVLSQSQVQTFMSDPTGVWLRGYWVHDERARMAYGYQAAFLPLQGWRYRVVLPLLDSLGVDPRALLSHMPNNYCNATHWGACGLVTDLGARQGARETLLTQHAARVCAP